ncbi:hypothetical protein [Candidatus Contubernalis alkaliaceticus]|uniref:hypothetical protein n=1 Tax=Candidatus Contubernalis alkaliaceticus TaxID=338645 RepID=UPI001F4BFFAE|nr:hypothetical protein [Candidatus Contubernalis alkalaceticus]UNC91673.1 hypothetical protein HUE98_05945 [Candidatus Contubernalis alkalaceticus]
MEENTMPNRNWRIAAVILVCMLLAFVLGTRTAERRTALSETEVRESVLEMTEQFLEDLQFQQRVLDLNEQLYGELEFKQGALELYEDVLEEVRHIRIIADNLELEHREIRLQIEEYFEAQKHQEPEEDY